MRGIIGRGRIFHSSSATRVGAAVALSVLCLVVSVLPRYEARGEEPPLSLVQGIVVGPQGEPPAGATVQAIYRGDRREETRVDAAGRFALRVPTQDMRGLTLVAVSSDGAMQGHYRYPWQIDNQSDANVRLTLAPTRTTVVVVRDGRGGPIADATVGMLADYCALAPQQSDAEGVATLHSPATMEIQAVYAMKANEGTDYRSYEPSRSDRAAGRDGARPEGRIALVLDGAVPVSIKLVDREHKPIANADVFPWLLSKPHEPNELNLSYLHSTVLARTDEQGVARFDWIPTWQSSALTIWPSSLPGYVRRRITYDPADRTETMTAVLDKVVPVSGCVRFEDGRPAAGIRVCARGAGYAIDDFSESTLTDDEGGFRFSAWPEELCMFVIDDKAWASAPIDGVVVHRDMPIDDLSFTLRPATRVFGRVTIGWDDTPVKDQSISLYQNGIDLRKTGQQIEIPDPRDSQKSIRPAFVRFTKTDADGRFELWVGPGEYSLRGPTQGEIHKFELTDASEHEFNFHTARAERGPFSGIVVSGDPPRPVAGAKVWGIYRHQLAGQDPAVVTDADGRFEIERELHAMVLFAESEDRQRAGSIDVSADLKSVTVSIGPRAKVTGRLIGRAKRPLAHHKIHFGTRVPLGGANSPWRTAGSGTVETDEEGRFEIDTLIPGRVFDISVAIDDNRSRRITEVVAIAGRTTELGDVNEPGNSQKRTGLTEELVAEFKSTKSPLQSFLAAVELVRGSRKQVLLLLADPTAAATVQLSQLVEESAAVHDALDRFEVVAIDAASDDNIQARKFAHSRHIDLNNRPLPLVCIFDGTGQAVGDIDIAQLTVNGAISAERFAEFLNRFAPESPKP